MTASIRTRVPIAVRCRSFCTTRISQQQQTRPKRPPFHVVEAGRPVFDSAARFQITKIPQPDWQPGQGLSQWKAALPFLSRNVHLILGLFQDTAEELEGHDLFRAGATLQGSRELFHHFETDKIAKPAVYKLLTGGVVPDFSWTPTFPGSWLI
jgi:hypothetical protein